MGEHTPTRGVPVELDRTRYLRYPLAAMKEVQNRFDVNLVAGEGLRTQSLDDVVWVIALGLRHEDPGEPMWWERALDALGLRPLDPRIDVEFVAEQIDMENIEAVTEAMQKAMGGGEADGFSDLVEREKGRQKGKARPEEEPASR